MRRFPRSELQEAGRSSGLLLQQHLRCRPPSPPYLRHLCPFSRLLFRLLLFSSPAPPFFSLSPLFSSPSSYSLSPSSLLRGSIPFPSGAPQRPPDLGRAGADPDPPGLALEWRRHDRHSASASELSLAALIPRPGKSGNFSALSLCSVISVVRSACSEVTGLARLKFRVAVEPSVRGALRALKTRG